MTPGKSASADGEREAEIRKVNSEEEWDLPADEAIHFLLAKLDQARSEHLKFIEAHNFGAFQTLKEERDAALQRVEPLKAELDWWKGQCKQQREQRFSESERELAAKLEAALAEAKALREALEHVQEVLRAKALDGGLQYDVSRALALSRGGGT